MKFLRAFVNGVFYDLLALGTRLFLAFVFLRSGLLKFNNYQDGHWETTVHMFRTLYSVPVLPPEIAAPLITGVELGAGMLLALGLFTRWSALALLLVLMLMHGALLAGEPAYWGVMLAFLMARGAGRLALGRLFRAEG